MKTTPKFPPIKTIESLPFKQQYKIEKQKGSLIKKQFKQTISAYNSLSKTIKSLYPNNFMDDELNEFSNKLLEQSEQFENGIWHELNKLKEEF